MKGTKGPKIRFPPGTFVELQNDPGAVFEVVQLYRLQDSPSEWVYRLLRISYRNQEPCWEPHKNMHKIWWTPIPKRLVICGGRGGPLDGGMGVNWTRAVTNQDMIRLATVRMDDLFES